MINRCVSDVWTAEAISVGSKIRFSMDEGAKVGVDSV